MDNTENYRKVYFISDSTAITVENLGNALLSQFKNSSFEKATYTFVTDIEKAQARYNQISTDTSNKKAIIFLSIANKEIAKMFRDLENVLIIDIFRIFMKLLEKDLGSVAEYVTGLSHERPSSHSSRLKTQAIDFAIRYDDGYIAGGGYDKAELILVGLSRSAKTPTTMYLAMQYGVFCTNYPLIPEDLEKSKLPDFLLKYKKKLFGLTISAERLARIRETRSPQTHYATIAQCQAECNEVRKIFDENQIPYVDSTHSSIEELASKIISKSGLKQHYTD